jgi:hypothetical protein
MNIKAKTVHINFHPGQQSVMSGAILSAMLRETNTDTQGEQNNAKFANCAPGIGEIWELHGGIYAGISRGLDGQPDAHLVLLEVRPDSDLNWADATKWAEGLGCGARLPTRFESALLYANLQDKLDTEKWHWTGTQYSDHYAFFQNFNNGTQYGSLKSAGGRARAVRRLEI